MKSSIVTFQLGKQKLTRGFIESLEKTFKKHELVKIPVLKSASRDRKEIKKIAETLCYELKAREKKDFTARVVGFTIFVRKWRKLKR